MEIRAGNPYPSTALSNFAPHKFIFRGVPCSSMEGLLQSLKYENPDMQRHMCTLVGYTAKKTGKNKNWWRTQTLYWDGKPIKRDSTEYQELLDEAYECLFYQNEKARKALLATGDATLKHSIGRHKINETVLTRQEFCSRLMKIRRDLQTADFFETNDEDRTKTSNSDTKRS